MATRIRDGVPGKEKTLPNQANPASRRLSTNPSPSPSRGIGAKTAAPSSDKNVQSNPRPTRSKLNADQPTQPAAAKKPAAATSVKPSVTRLRSFEKSLPPVRQSANPKEKIMRPSSSFSGSRSTGTTLQKGASNRLVKTAPKNSNVTTKKTGGSSASSARTSRSPSVLSSPSARTSRSPSIMSSPERVEDLEITNVPHPREDDRQSSVTGEEVSINALKSHVTNEQVPIDASSNLETTADIAKENRPQQIDPPVQAKSDIHEQKDIKISKPVISEGRKKTETEDQKAPGQQASRFHLESQQLQEQLKDNRTDPVNANFEVQAENQGNKEVKDATEAMKKKEEVKEEDQVVNKKETVEVKNIASPEPKLELQSEPEQKPEPESKPALAPATAPEDTKTASEKRPIIVQGKKDAAAVSNDTIEETASKLQEQRKNRVRALAGAFESVISRQ